MVIKSISGTYKDRHNFSHTIFYDRNKHKWIKIISNPEGKYCSSNEYTRKQILNMLGGMSKVQD